MEFKNLYLFFLGMAGLFIWGLGYWNFFRKSSIYIPAKYTVKKGVGLRTILFLLGMSAWLFIGFSLMGPRVPVGNIKNSVDVNDIFFIVDTSGSMEANDFQPNRLEAAKEKILDFVELKPADRIGIVIFGEDAFTLLPLTTDLKLIKQVVAEIKIGLLGGGTNIGDAIGLAVARGAQSLADNKAIILLTDGASNVGSLSPVEAAERAKEQNMKIYTIGIGTKNAKIPRKTYFGTQYVTIRGGGYDIKTLKEISQITGGKNYVAKNVEALKEVLHEIEELERTKIDVQSRIVYKELYLKFLLIGVLLLLGVEIARKLIIREGA